MNMNKRLDGIEKQLNLKKELDYELEMTLVLDAHNEVAPTYRKIGPDGQREKIDYAQAQQLMEHDTECEVSIID